MAPRVRRPSQLPRPEGEPERRAEELVAAILAYAAAEAADNVEDNLARISGMRSIIAAAEDGIRIAAYVVNRVPKDSPGHTSMRDIAWRSGVSMAKETARNYVWSGAELIIERGLSGGGQ